jgi:hypothetical protein
VRHSSTIAPLDRRLFSSSPGAPLGGTAAFVVAQRDAEQVEGADVQDERKRRIAAARLVDLPPEIALRLVPPALGLKRRGAALRVARRRSRGGCRRPTTQ